MTDASVEHSSTTDSGLTMMVMIVFVKLCSFIVCVSGMTNLRKYPLSTDSYHLFQSTETKRFMDESTDFSYSVQLLPPPLHFRDSRCFARPELTFFGYNPPTPLHFLGSQYFACRANFFWLLPSPPPRSGRLPKSQDLSEFRLGNPGVYSSANW